MAERDAAVPELEELRRRDAGAFARLVSSQQSLVMSLGQSMGLRGMDLEDAVGEVFDCVYRSLPGFGGRSAVRTWVYRIAVRVLSRHRRRRKREMGEALPEEVTDLREAGPAEKAAEAEQNRRIWAAVAKLGTRSAAAVELYYRQGWSVEEIGEALECPVGTVKTLLYRAREQLRGALRAEQEDP